jgi:hypothetical protein
MLVQPGELKGAPARWGCIAFDLRLAAVVLPQRAEWSRSGFKPTESTMLAWGGIELKRAPGRQ